MDPVRNPFQPGAGRRPPELTGRAVQLESFQVVLQRCEAGFSERGVILHGLRGVGKTVLLGEFAAMAGARHWIVAKIEASTEQSATRMIAQSLHRALREATGQFGPSRLGRLLGVFKSFTVKVDPTGTYSFGVDVAATTGRADTGDLSLDLTELFAELGRTARELGVGALLVIDEMQDMSAAELIAVNKAVHEAGQGASPLPVAVVGAGLPSLPTVLAEATSYAERLYSFAPIGRLTGGADAQALVGPVRALGAEWGPDALAAALDFARGYPYFVQTVGKFVWDYATASPFSEEDVEVGVAKAREEIDAGLFLSRWNRVTPAEREFLRAIAAAGSEQVATQDVATRLGRRRGDLSVRRDQLIKKGVIYAPERGYVAFTVPGMAEYIARQP
jgi:hypothetical protein